MCIGSKPRTPPPPRTPRRAREQPKPFSAQEIAARNDERRRRGLEGGIDNTNKTGGIPESFTTRTLKFGGS